jgi:hypothetical protein
MQLPSGREVWTTLPRTYVKNSLFMVEHLLEEDGKGYVLKLNVQNPLPTGYYKPEIDVTKELNQTLASHYMQLIGMLCWAMEIGQINIFLEVSLLSICHVFAYLKKHPDMSKLAYDSKHPDIDEYIFHPNADWNEFELYFCLC